MVSLGCNGVENLRTGMKRSTLRGNSTLLSTCYSGKLVVIPVPLNLWHELKDSVETQNEKSGSLLRKRSKYSK